VLALTLVALALGARSEGLDNASGNATGDPAAEGPVPFSEVAAQWSALHTPAPGRAAAIGGYAAGCLQGGVALPPSGPGYELLHLGRRRGFGHPALVRFVRRLGASVKRSGLGMLLVGDLGQARGGPTPSGHRSHQSGLDVDLGYGFPQWVLRRRPTAAERETIMPPAVVDLATRTLTPLWQTRVMDVLRLAAEDPDVDRIFVNPVVKREICARVRRGLDWVRKLRPWWAHHDHFHVRLRCPPGSAECEPQLPIDPDDGCGETLAWWFRPPPPPPQPPPPGTPSPPSPPPPPEPSAPALPAHCELVRVGEE
jgi:penicillin-insensitive murein endopeptidase